MISVGSVVLACLLAASSARQPEVRHVLMLESLGPGSVVQESFAEHFRVDMDRLAGTPVNVVEAVVGQSGFGAPDQAAINYIRSIYPGGSQPDLIVTTGAPAAIFVRKYRGQLFPNAPLLFTCVDQRFLNAAPLDNNETAVSVVNDFSLIVGDILQLLPQTKQVFVVIGSAGIGTYWRRTLEEDFKRFGNRVTFVWSDKMSLPEILSRCASLPPRSAIYFFAYGTDKSGAAYADDRVLEELHATANAPMFGAQSVMLGRGIAGGRVMDLDRLADKSAEVGIRLMKGEQPANLRIPAQTPGRPVFDWRELKRWGISESRLTPGSVVLFRAPGPWQEYRVAILSVLGALLIQSILIIGLIYQRRARQRAEVESRRNLALAADIGRRQTMTALTSSISHELGQPLNSMIFNAQALQMMVAADQANTATIAEILSDIQTQGARAADIMNRHRTMLRGRAVEKKAIDFHDVITESVALVSNDMKERQIEARVDLSSGPCVVNGDKVLLQQVLVNLMLNAMDAMAEKPREWRRVTIRSEVKNGTVETSVRDSGPGLSPRIIETLFTPFVTTKANGLGIGLTIVRSIVDAHGGSIDARNNPDGGATFTVTLPWTVPQVL